MSERHCPGCHGHIYDELDEFDPCNEHGRADELPECPGVPPCPECERLGDTLRQLAEAQAHVRDHHIEACVSCAVTESEHDALTATLALAREWATAYAALSNGRDADESNRLELAFNATCERLYEALDAGEETQP